MGVVGCSTCLIFFVMCGGMRSGSFAFFGYSLCVVLHAFLSFASLPMCRSPAREIGGFSVIGIVGSCLVYCVGHILVAMSW
jgi:hypothetical protein